MVKQTIARPSRVLFFAVQRDQDAPAQVKKINPNLKATFLFGFAKFIALRAYTFDRQVFYFENAITGDILEVPMPIPRDWVAEAKTHT